VCNLKFLGLVLRKGITRLTIIHVNTAISNEKLYILTKKKNYDRCIGTLTNLNPPLLGHEYVLFRENSPEEM
jgi:acyl CoA:acetate/3-ketoacid CoA transferase alpha subunit